MTQASRSQGGTVPILLSCLVCPGLGQMLQKRWLAGAFYGAGFLAALAMLLREVLGPMLRNLQLAIAAAANESGAPFVEISVPRILAFLALALCVYGINVVDVVRAQRRPS